MKNILIISLITISIIKLTISNTNIVKGKVIHLPNNLNNNQISFDMEDNSSTTVSLEGPVIRTAFITDEGNFEFSSVPVGSYFVYVNDPNNEYETAIVEVTESEVKAYQVNYKHAKGFKHKDLQLKPIGKIKYEEEQQSVVSSLIKSPYMIIIGMTLLMFVCMQMVPKDQLNEQFKEMNKQMNQYQNMSKSFGDNNKKEVSS